MKTYAAVDIGGTNIKYGIVDDTGKVLFQSKTATEAQKGGGVLVQRVTGIIADLVKTYPDVRGIGISTAGVVDTAAGCILYANSNLPEYTGTQWKKILTERFALPVYVCNDVHAAGAAEAWVGAGRNCGNFLCVAVGTGIGGSVFIGGRPFTGPHFRAAALGYMNTAGGTEIYEKKGSTQALVDRITAATGDPDVSGKNAFSRAREGNAAYAQNLEQWFDELAKGIANAIFCYDPELIIIGGAICNEGQPLLDRIHSALTQYVPQTFLDSIVLKTAECTNNAGMVGAVYNLVIGL